MEETFIHRRERRPHLSAFDATLSDSAQQSPSHSEWRGSLMTIRRRESKDGPRFDVEWRLPDRAKRSKTFKSEREARVFEASLVTKFAAGDIVDPRAGRVTLAAVYRAWLASRVDLSPKVRRGYQDNWRNRIEPRFGGWHVANNICSSALYGDQHVTRLRSA